MACSADQAKVLSTSIIDLTQEVVAKDPANLGLVLSVLQSAAVTEYHSDASAPGCARQAQILTTLQEVADALNSEDAAMLVTDQT